MTAECFIIATACDGDCAVKYPGIRVISVGFLTDLYELEQMRDKIQ